MSHENPSGARRRPSPFLFVLLLAAGALAPAPPVPAQEPPPLRLNPAAPSLFQRIDPGRAVEGPRIRIGLRHDDAQVRIGSSSGRVRLLDGQTGAEVWPERAAGTLLVVPEGGKPGPTERVFRIQIGAFRDEAAARSLAESLAARWNAPVEAGFDPVRMVWRVRAGVGEKPGDLLTLLDTARREGYPDAWVASDPKPAAAGSPGGLRLVDARWESRPAGAASLVVVPDEGARVTVEGKPYRGLVELVRTPAGGVLAINELNLEDYLKGVVPEELGPGLFPEIEALKAQAIAARTYAYANLGQYAAEGFDLCDTPRCQVYGGAASEHRLSNRAIAETEGEVLAYDGTPINALFTSTCGGHTEDVDAVFPEIAQPYLRGVPCRALDEAMARQISWFQGRHVPAEPLVRVPLEPDPLQVGRLVARGIVPREALHAGWRAAPVGAGEVQAWASALARLADHAAPAALRGTPTRIALWRWLADGIDAPLDRQALPPGDAAMMLVVEDAEALARDDRLVIATLIARGIVRASLDGRLRAAEVPPRGEVLGWLWKIAETYDTAPLREGTFVGREGAMVTLRERGGAERTYSIGSPAPDLFAEGVGAWYRISQLHLLPGDRIVFVADPDGRIALLGARERKGGADDRLSPRFRWTIARDREQLEKGIGELSPVGRILDINVLRRGRSGRVSAVEVRGSEGKATLEGFRFSRAIDLPETLFSMELLRDPDGAVRRAIFNGRGWGHGVGLCQYGAFGMALRGVGYREILAHYYQGAGLVRAGASRAAAR